MSAGQDRRPQAVPTSSHQLSQLRTGVQEQQVTAGVMCCALALHEYRCMVLCASALVACMRCATASMLGIRCMSAASSYTHSHRPHREMGEVTVLRYSFVPMAMCVCGACIRVHTYERRGSTSRGGRYELLVCSERSRNMFQRSVFGTFLLPWHVRTSAAASTAST